MLRSAALDFQGHGGFLPKVPYPGGHRPGPAAEEHRPAAPGALGGGDIGAVRVGALGDDVIFTGGLIESEIAEEGVVLHHLRELRVFLPVQPDKLSLLLLLAVHDQALVVAGFGAGGLFPAPDAPAHIHGLEGLVPHTRFPGKAHMAVVPLAGGGQGQLHRQAL